MKKKRKTKNTQGRDLFNHVVRLTGVPADKLRRELEGVLRKRNIDINQLTLDQLRVAVASYLRDIMGAMLDRYNQRRTDS